MKAHGFRILTALAVIAAFASSAFAAIKIDASELVAIESPTNNGFVSMDNGAATARVHFKVMFGEVKTGSGDVLGGADPTTFTATLSGMKASIFLAQFQPIIQGGQTVGMEAFVDVPPKISAAGEYKTKTFKAKVKSVFFPNPNNPIKLIRKPGIGKIKFTPRPNAVPVIASFNVSANVMESVPAAFTANVSDADGDALTYTLDFGDGAPPATGNVSGGTISVQHTYAAAATRTATLTVRDWGSEDVETLQVVVMDFNQPPIITEAVVTNPDRTDGPDIFTVNIGKTPEFRFKVSDPDGDPVTSYTINFGHGTPQTGNNPGGYSTVTASHAYPASSAAYTVTFSASDGVNTVNKTITVKINVAPVISSFNVSPVAGTLPGGVKVVNIGATLTFTGAASDPEANPLTYNVSFGNGESASGLPATYTYSEGGDMTAVLSVSDGAATTQMSLNLRVNSKPTAKIYVAPWQAAWGYPVTIDGIDSTDPDGDALTYGWNFGDGTTGNGASVTHVYSGSLSATRTITLTATDAYGLTSTAQYGLSLKGALTAEPMIDVVSPIHKGNQAADQNIPISIDLGRTSTGALADLSTLIIKLNKVDVAQYFSTVTDPARGGLAVGLSGAIPLDLLKPSGSSAVKTDGKYNVLKVICKSMPFQKIGGGIITKTDTDVVKFSVTVNRAPSVSLVVTPPAGGNYIGLPFKFDASGSSDPESQTLTYKWNFGDGSPEANGAVVFHTFDAAVTYTVKVTVSDGVWSPSQTASVNVNNPIVSPGITVGQSGGSTDVSEDGTNDSYTLVLESQPTANVTINLTTIPSGQITVNPTSVTFTPANWDVYQSVTVAAVDDAVVEAPQHTAIVRHTVSSADSGYNGFSVPDLTVYITDDDAPPPSAGVQITENGGSTQVLEGALPDTYEIVLLSPPVSNVTITMSFDNSQVDVSPASVTFTPTNWNQRQFIGVWAVDDAVEEEPIHTSTITHAVASGSDSAYIGASIASVTVSIIDDDGPPAPSGMQITPSGIIDFGAIDRDAVQWNEPVGTTRLVEVKNAGTSAFTVESVFVSGSKFAVKWGWSSPLMNPGDIHFIVLSFIPRASTNDPIPSAQTWQGTVTIQARKYDGLLLQPEDISLRAETVDSVSGPSIVRAYKYYGSSPIGSPAAALSAGGGLSIQYHSTILNFGTWTNIQFATLVPSIGVSVRAAYVHNQGGAQAFLSAPELSGPDAGHFSVFNSSGASIGSGQKTDLHYIRFLPQGAASTQSRRFNAKLTYTVQGTGQKIEFGLVADWTYVTGLSILNGNNKPLFPTQPEYFEFDRIAKGANTTILGSDAGTENSWITPATLTVLYFGSGSGTLTSNFSAIAAVSPGGNGKFSFTPSTLSLNVNSPVGTTTGKFTPGGAAGHHSAYLTITATGDPNYQNRTLVMHGHATGIGDPGALGSSGLDYYTINEDNFYDINDNSFTRVVVLSPAAAASTIGANPGGQSLAFVNDPFLVSSPDNYVDLYSYGDESNNLWIIDPPGTVQPYFYTVDSEIFGPYTPGSSNNTTATNNRLSGPSPGNIIGSGGVLTKTGFVNNTNNAPDFRAEGAEDLDIAVAYDDVQENVFVTEVFKPGASSTTRILRRAGTSGNFNAVSGLSDVSMMLAGVSGLEVSEMQAIKTASGFRLFITLNEARLFAVELNSSGAYVSKSELTSFYPGGVPATNYKGDRNGNWFMAMDNGTGLIKVYKVNLLNGQGHPSHPTVNAPWAQVQLPLNDGVYDGETGLLVDNLGYISVHTNHGVCQFNSTATLTHHYWNVGGVWYANNGVGISTIDGPDHEAAFDVDFVGDYLPWYATR